MINQNSRRCTDSNRKSAKLLASRAIAATKYHQMKIPSNTNPIRQLTGSFVSLGCVAIALLALATQSASAQNGTWTNRTSSIWSAATNWSAATVANGQDSTANFSTLAALTNITVTLDSPRTLGNLKFGVLTTNTYLVGANTLTLSTSANQPTVTVTNQTATLGVPLTSSQQVLINGQSSVIVTNALNSFTGGLILQCGQFGFTSQGAVGSGDIQIGNGPGGSSAPPGQCGINSISTAPVGTAPITLNNNFIIRSTRWIFGQNALGQNAQPLIINGNVTLDQGTNANPDFAFNNGSSMTVNGVVSTAAGAPAVNGIRFNALGGSTLALDNSANTFQGNITFVTANTLGITADGSLGYYLNKLVFTAGGTLRADAPFTLAAARSPVTMTATVTFNCQTNNVEIDPYMTGAGGLTKNGTGTLLVTSGFNTFTGPVTVNGGTLDLTGNLAAGVASVTINNTGLTNGSDFLLDTGSSASPNLSVTINNGCTFDATAVGGYEFVAGKTLSVSAGGFVKATGGTLTLDAGATFIAGTGTTTNVAAVDGNMAASSGSMVIPGTQGTAGTISISNALTLNGQTLQFDLRNNTTEGMGTNDEIIVGGNLTLNGGETIALNYMDGQLAAGTYKLIKFGGNLTGSFALATVYPNVTIDNGGGTPGYVTLVVSAPSVASTLFWQGDGSGNVWDTNNTPNWVTSFGNAAVNYIDPDKVIFDNNGSNNVPVNLTLPVYPNAVTFSNTTAKSYTISGNGKITGPEGVTLAGNGTNTFLTGNDYAGGTTFITNGVLQVGNGGATGAAGSGTINMGSRSPSIVVNLNDAISLPSVTGTGGSPTLFQNGAGTTILTGTADNTLLTATVNNGILQLAKTSSGGVHAVTNATVNAGGTLQLGGTGGDQIQNAGSVTLAGGAFDANSQSETLTALNGYGNITDSSGAGVLTLTAGNAMNVANGTMNYNTISSTFNAAAGQFLVTSGSTLNMLGGAITLGSVAASDVNSGGVFNMSGGTLTTSTYFGVGSGGVAAAPAIANFSGGTFISTGEFLQGYQGPANISISGNALWTLHFFSYGNDTLTNYLNGGKIQCLNFNQRGSGLTVWFFNGVTIQALANGGTTSPGGFFPSQTTYGTFNKIQTNQFAYISTNGFTMDCQGFNIAIAQNLLHDPALGAGLDGGLTKLGSGTLTLTGTNSFNGSLTNSAGTLIFNNNGAYNNVVVGDNAINQVNLVAAGTSLTNNTLTVGISGSGTQTLNFNLGTAGTPTAPLMVVNGAVTNNGNVTVALLAPVLTPGTVPLFRYGSMDAANFASTWSVNPFPYVSLTLTNDAVQKLVSIIVVPGVTPKWKGNLSSAWDTSTLNWTSNGVPAAYIESAPPGEPVTFDDTAVNFNVDISTATVNPLFINMTNSAHDYLLTGSVGIGGTGALIKNGNGALILGNGVGANTYSGITMVSGGSMLAQQANVLSPNSVMTFNNSTLNISNYNQTFGSLILNNTPLLGTGTLTAAGGGSILTFNNSSNQVLGVSLAGNLSLSQNGAGELDLTNTSTYSGNTTINNGIVRLLNGNGLGVGGFTGGTGVAVQPGARLILDGSFTTTKGINTIGGGPDGFGSLVVTNGNVIDNGSPCSVAGSIYVAAGSSMDFQGQAGGNAAALGGAYTKYGPGDLLVGGLPANNSTATPVVVAEGRLVGTNCTVTGFITVSNGATLSGNGPFTGGINVLAGGNLAPNMSGTMTAMTASAGVTNAGVITLQINKNSSATNADMISCTAAFVNTGTVTVTNSAATTLPLAAGDTFRLFTLTNYTALTGVTPTLPVLPSSLAWSNGLAVNGTISVVASGPGVFTLPTGITAFSLSGTNVMISGTNGQAGAAYYLLSSTNLTLPLNQWTAVATNVPSVAGPYTFTATNAVFPGVQQQFFMLSNTNF